MAWITRGKPAKARKRKMTGKEQTGKKVATHRLIKAGRNPSRRKVV